jgi:hypothetical protein
MALPIRVTPIGPSIPVTEPSETGHSESIDHDISLMAHEVEKLVLEPSKVSQIDDITDARSDELFITGASIQGSSDGEQQLDDLVHKLFNPSQVGLESKEEEDAMAKQHFDVTVAKKDGRYEVALPFKPDHKSILCSNTGLA